MICYPSCDIINTITKEVTVILINNVEIDVKVKCLEAKMTQEQLATKIGTTGQYVNRVIKKKDGFLNKTFVEIMEALGYDIELTYVKREGL